MSLFTAEQLAAINARIANGVKRTTVEGSTTEYDSLDDALKAKRLADTCTATDNDSMGVRFHSINPPAAVRGPAS